MTGRDDDDVEDDVVVVGREEEEDNSTRLRGLRLLTAEGGRGKEAAGEYLMYILVGKEVPLHKTVSAVVCAAVGADVVWRIGEALLVG